MFFCCWLSHPDKLFSLSWSMLELKVFLISIVLDWLAFSSRIVVSLWPKIAFRWKFSGTISITFRVIGKQLLVSKLSNVSHWVSSPHLSCWDQSTGLYDGVRKDLATSFQSGSLLNNAIMSDNDIVINNAGVNIAVSTDCHILSNINWGSDTMR